MLEMIATSYIDQPTKTIVPRRPIRTGDELAMIALVDTRLEHEPSPTNAHLLPKVLCPLQFRNEADSNIRAIDQYGPQIRVDRSTGKTIRGKASNDLFHGVAAAIWSDEGVTMSTTVNHRASRKDMPLSNLAGMMTLSGGPHSRIAHLFEVSGERYDEDERSCRERFH
jgi:hypothetical protein